MIRFDSDYTEGAHPYIMKRLNETNLEQTPGYGTDEHCRTAAEYIKRECENRNVDVHFLIGGTQTNVIALDTMLKPYQAVISADTGHINVHETGAVEGCGHKILTIHSDDGKIYAEEIRRLCRTHYADSSREHTVQPGAVYISFPTENGTIYSKAEIKDIFGVCREFGMYLYIDGARMGYGLASPKNDMTLNDFCRFSDAFYIGGTKVGALFGEAFVITNDALKKDFRYMMKHSAGMLAKGRLLGIQFEVLFENGLYTAASSAAVREAMKIKKCLTDKKIPLLYDSYTNQQFPIFTDSQLKLLSERYVFSEWSRVDECHTAVRICTSWATNPRAVAELIRDIESI